MLLPGAPAVSGPRGTARGPAATGAAYGRPMDTPHADDTRPRTRPDHGPGSHSGSGPDTLAERIAAYENRAVEAFYLDPYLVGLLAARPCEAADELPPPGMAFA